MPRPAHHCGTLAGRQEAVVIVQSAHTLGSYVDDFGAAVSLTEHCRGLMKLAREAPDRRSANSTDAGRWALIAARDAVASVRHLGKALSLLSTQRCPTLHASVRQEMLFEARDLFAHAFPDAKDFRDTVAHRAEHVHSIFELDRHRLPGCGIVRGMLHGSIYLMHYQGRELALELSWDTHARLAAVYGRVSSAFRTAQFC
jgi:hypothetical protein